ncbi:MAG: Holliday junction branch migration protein RuvA [Tissierellia bacterium]|nr:Holliday junction branch migration protein RuvA [Tissierellia bacterium]
MFSYIIGEVKYIGNSYIILENNNIGYKILMSQRNISNLLLNETHKIYTEFIVREDGVYLYGFYSIEELEMFLNLNTVSSIGPKVSLAILSALTINELKRAIANNDIITITKAQGVGKKSASRIILELSDKIRIEELVGKDDENNQNIMINDNYEIALEALINLGFTKQDAVKKLKGIETAELELSEIIKIALKSM